MRPYPGLASFTEEDAEYFFGRELEVEAMWKKLRRPHLLGLIGPSGAGKSSFLRAGLLPVMPEGWRALVTTSGTVAIHQSGPGSWCMSLQATRRLTRAIHSVSKKRTSLSPCFTPGGNSSSTGSSSSTNSKSCSRSIRTGSARLGFAVLLGTLGSGGRCPCPSFHAGRLSLTTAITTSLFIPFCPS